MLHALPGGDNLIKIAHLIDRTKGQPADAPAISARLRARRLDRRRRGPANRPPITRYAGECASPFCISLRPSHESRTRIIVRKFVHLFLSYEVKNHHRDCFSQEKLYWR
jgi:hypothetical protein